MVDQIKKHYYPGKALSSRIICNHVLYRRKQIWFSIKHHNSRGSRPVVDHWIFYITCRKVELVTKEAIPASNMGQGRDPRPSRLKTITRTHFIHFQVSDNQLVSWVSCTYWPELRSFKFADLDPSLHCHAMKKIEIQWKKLRNCDVSKLAFR